MRIAIVTSFARGAGGNGEDLAVMDQAELLRAAGHEVLLLSRATDAEIHAPGYRVRAGVNVATGWGPDPLPRLEAYAPDVVHVHNTYPNIGRHWARKCALPLVVTLHSFRYFCAAGTFFRDGKICTDCLDAPMSATRHGCYEGPLRSLPYSLAGLRRRSDALIGNADRIIALNPTMRRFLLDEGVAEGRVVEGINTVLPTISESSAAPTSSWVTTPDDEPQPWLYVGRLIPAKGIVQLLQSWPAQVPLWIIGDGPQRDEVEALAGARVKVLGQRSREEVHRAMRSARGLVVPSLWFEGQPLVYLEALTAGLPTLAYAPNAVAQLVSRDGTGRVTNWDENLPKVLAGATEEFADLRDHCRAVFARCYSPDVYLSNLEQIYDDAIRHRRGLMLG